MLAASTDIRFSCPQCGQRMVTEMSGAGHRMNCPDCHAVLTVPLVSTDFPAEDEESAGDNLRSEVHWSAPIEGLPSAESLAQELEAAKKELGRVQSQYRKALDDRERLTASLTHSQAENKSFQSDRQQLKAELSQTRQRATTAETQMAELAAALGNVQVEQEQAGHDLGLIRERLAATETQLGVRERELNEARGENSELMQGLAHAQAELASATGKAARLAEDVAAAQRLLAEAEADHQRTEEAKRLVESCLTEATAESHRLRGERDQWRQETEGLRRDLNGTEHGQELLTLRERVRELQAQTELLEMTLEGRAEEMQRLVGISQTQAGELETLREAHIDAERRAEAGAESKLQKDNELLRGIIARQNATLEMNYVEVRQLRRGRYWMRTVYALFGFGVLALGFFAIQVFAPGGIENLVPTIQKACTSLGGLIRSSLGR